MAVAGSGTSRREVFSCAGPVGIEVGLGVGEIRVQLAETAQVTVEVWSGGGWFAAAQPTCPQGGVWPRGGYTWGWHPGHHPVPVPPVPPVPPPGGGWAWGPGHGPIPPGHAYAPGYGVIPPGHGYLPGYGAVPGGVGAVVPGGVAALDGVAIAFAAETGLRVGVPTGHPLWSTALAVDITAPVRSRLNLRTGSGSIAVAGTAATASLVTGSGSLDLERAEESALMETGSGSLAAGHLSGSARLRTGSGMVDLGTVDGEVTIHAGTGQIAVSSVRRGRLDAFTNSGEIRASVPRDRVAEVDAQSGSGSVLNDLVGGPQPPADAPSVQIRARTGSGRVWIARAAG